ncbi:MAG: DNA mismatch repair endonuclease MutL [Candidatus Neomarinimicrobiota bacterium]|nr:DNA mismatch repair endonuclease MutL [Candidatus Neomarinimicrobiota bacterium]RKY48811.1 MAG: DNA mismatch repair endonuclease MutL [Candidatus Neomarinimicrobiota bacterium]
MSKIRILPETLTNKIAAGEVVQRPASVVKELMENSIDAEARTITVIIKNGGKSLIQVVDDGNGMDRDDLLLAFERYATSKIKDEDDLSRISTLGFRGEALASIASVSIVDAVSGVKGDMEAYELKIVGGEFKDIRPHSNIGGTSISIRNLFFNVPARRKFLKSAEIELKNIIDIFRKFALAYPEKSFVLIHNDREIYNLRPSDLADRIAELYSPEYRKNIVEVSVEERELSISGFIGNLNLIRPRRGEQTFFVNRRYVSNRTLSNAVISAYRSVISGDEYPFYCLNLMIPPDKVDVNVHPAKMEVKFREDYRVFQFVKISIGKYVEEVKKSIPGFDKPRIWEYYETKKESGGFAEEKDRERKVTAEIAGLKLEDADNRSQVWKERAKKFSEHLKEESSVPPGVGIPVFQFAERYIITQVKSGLVIIDQHVAHERILYEAALKAVTQGSWKPQQLLFPQVIELSAEDFSVLLEILPYLNKIGFRMREFGRNTIVVDAVPTGMRWGRESTIIKEIIDTYVEYRKHESSAVKSVAASYACKAAIKAGDKLSEEEMINLVDRLFTTSNPYFCPHGRPIIVNLSLDEIDKRFKRK